MITIDDFDMPITAAEKLIRGTRPFATSEAMKAFKKALLPGADDAANEDMFSLEELKEIADYLTVYYESHKKEGD